MDDDMPSKTASNVRSKIAEAEAMKKRQPRELVQALGHVDCGTRIPYVTFAYFEKCMCRCGQLGRRTRGLGKVANRAESFWLERNSVPIRVHSS